MTRWLPLVLLALAVLLAPVVWHLAAPLSGGGAQSSRTAAELAIQSARIALLEEETQALRERVDALERRNAVPEDAPLPDLPSDAAGSTFGGFDEQMLLSERREISAGLNPLKIADLVAAFGTPAPALSDQCIEPTSERLVAALEIRDVGPFRARMIRPALDSLERIFERVSQDYPALYRQIRTYGGFCVRLIRGSEESISRHAFGVALDVSIGGTLDAMGDGQTQFGLIILNDYFYEEGWIWGAAFGREDSMHFEVSAELLKRWMEDGSL